MLPFAWGWFSQTLGKVMKTQPDFYKTLSTVLGVNYELLHPQVEPQKFFIRGTDASAPKAYNNVLRSQTTCCWMWSMQMLSQLWLLHVTDAWRAISGVRARPANYFKQPGYHIALHDAVVMYLFAVVLTNWWPHLHQTGTHRPGDAYRASQFDIYKKHGFQVHLDNPEIDYLTHFAQADVLICSRSMFSTVISIAVWNCIQVVQLRAQKR